MDKLYSFHLKTVWDTVWSEGPAFISISIYLFFEYVRPQSIYTQIDIIPWVPLVLLCALFFIFCTSVGQSHPNILNKLIIVYGSVILLSSTFSEYPSLSFSRLEVFFDWFIIYFLIVKIINNEKRFYLFFVAFLIFSFKMSQHGFLTWAQRGFSFTSWGVTGAPGWFQNSGEVGIQMCIFVPMAIAYILATFRYQPKFWMVFFALMPITGIGTAIASSSRGALVGLAGAGCWSILKRPKVFIVGFFLLFFAAFIVYHFIPEESLKRFESSGEDQTSLHRKERWRDGYETLLKFPVLGVGFETWDVYYPENFLPKYKGSNLVHNIFVQCFTELGAMGLIVFVSMICGCFSMTKNIRKKVRYCHDKFIFIISYGLDSALIGFLVSGSFVTVLYYPYFWIHCSLISCLHTVVIKKLHSDSNV